MWKKYSGEDSASEHPEPIHWAFWRASTPPCEDLSEEEPSQREPSVSERYKGPLLEITLQQSEQRVIRGVRRYLVLGWGELHTNLKVIQKLLGCLVQHLHLPSWDKVLYVEHKGNSNVCLCGLGSIIVIKSSWLKSMRSWVQIQAWPDGGFSFEPLFLSSPS